MKVRVFKQAGAVVLFIAGCAGLGAQAVVATTEWTAAFCRAAGMENVRVLAPAALQHPPDYELKPSDIPMLMDADIIVFGGYEGMVERIQAQIAGSDTRMVRIETVYNPPAMEKSIRTLADVSGKMETAERNIAAIRAAWDEARRLVTAAGMKGSKAAVHRFQADFAREAGLNVVLEFGPPPPGPRLIADAGGSGAVLVIDNRHNPVAAPIREVLKGAKAVELANFPDTGENLHEVILRNARVLTGQGK
jgi:hypothetical protein